MTLIDNNDVYMHTTWWFKEEKFGKILKKIWEGKYEWKVGILWKKLHDHKSYFDAREGEKLYKSNFFIIEKHMVV